MLLGAVIERVSGTSYDDHVAARVHAPAGMTATGSAPEDSLVPGRAVGYMRQLVPGALVSNAPTLPYRGTPAGGGYSTVGTSRASPSRFGSTGSWIRRTRRCSSREGPVGTGCSTRTGSSTASWAAGVSSGTAGARRG
jgi:CubicO group peptidase (beta-lactamase class C family)